ncbi:hypothetical protein GCM10027299_28630 [Larkinella ripae]
MEEDLLEIQGELLAIRETLDHCAEQKESIDVYTLGQIKVQLLDLITITELLIVTNQAAIPPQSLDGQSSDHRSN